MSLVRMRVWPPCWRVTSEGLGRRPARGPRKSSKEHDSRSNSINIFILIRVQLLLVAKCLLPFFSSALCIFSRDWSRYCFRTNSAWLWRNPNPSNIVLRFTFEGSEGNDLTHFKTGLTSSVVKAAIVVQTRGHQRGARGHHVPPKDQVGRPRACSEYNISMINVFALTNINIKIIEGELSKFFTLEVYIKLVALRINRYTRSSSQFRKGWWPLVSPGVDHLEGGRKLLRIVQRYSRPSFKWTPFSLNPHDCESN